jgi:serine/threonine-protein kinase RsbW
MAISRRFAAELNNLEPIRSFVEEAATLLGADSNSIQDMFLAVTELVTNTIEHGYRDQTGGIEIEVERQAGRLIIRLRDQAVPFDPTVVPAPDVTLPLDERPLGGLGIYLSKKVMDEVQYRITDSGNELTLIKKIAAQETEDGHQR